MFSSVLSGNDSPARFGQTASVADAHMPIQNMFDKRYCRECLKWVKTHYLQLRAEGRLNAKEDKRTGSFRVRS